MQFMFSLRSLANSTWCRRRSHSYCRRGGFNTSGLTGFIEKPSRRRSSPDSTDSDPGAESIASSASSDSSWDRGNRPHNRGAWRAPTYVPGPRLSVGNPSRPQAQRQWTYETINDGRSVEEVEFDVPAVDQQASSRLSPNVAPFVPIGPPPGLCDETENAKQQPSWQEASSHKSQDSGWQKPQPRPFNANSRQLKWDQNLRDTLVALSQGREPRDVSNNARDSHLFAPQRRPMPKIRHVWYGAPPDDENSFRSNMKKMAKYSKPQIFLARKVGKLGFNSAHFLELHFKQFGKVETVLVSHSVDKSNQYRQKPRIRPAAVAFVVMGTAQQVGAVLAAGPVQIVHGVDVSVCEYESQPIFHDDQAEVQDKVFDEYKLWADREAAPLAG